MIDPTQQGFMNQPAQFAGQFNQFQNGYAQAQHAKSFSLPVSFDPQQNQAQIPPPPERACNAIGDVPLPPGWVSEKAPNGQTYFYNHMTKQSSWEDPRKMYNLPMYQNEINYDLKAHIYKSIPLPSGWQEARTETGKPYYINHNTRMTHWEDPRIEIYMQQVHQNQYAQQGGHNMAPQMQAAPVQTAMQGPGAFGQQQPMNPNPAYNQQGGFNMGAYPQQYAQPQNPGSAVKNQHLAPAVNAVRMSPMLKSPASMHNMQSNPSLHSSSLGSLSNSSSSSSLSSALSSSQELLSAKPLVNLSNASSSQYIQSLRRSLDKVLENKQSICSRLNELVEQENNLKAKMRPQDIEEVMKLIKEGATMRAKAPGLEAPKMVANTAPQVNAAFPGVVCKPVDMMEAGHNTTDPGIEIDQLDSTLVVADTSANNSNVMNE